MTAQVRIVPAVLSAAIVLFGFGYFAVGRAHATNAPAVRTAPALVSEIAPSDDIAEVRVIGRRGRSLSVWNQG
jgi:hypothetical protein